MARALILFLLLATGLVAQTDSLNVWWDPNPETDMSYYELYISKNSGPFSLKGNIPHPQTKFVDTEVAPGNRYSYYLVAVDESGNKSNPCNAVSVGIPLITLSVQSGLSGRTDKYALKDFLYDPDDPVDSLAILILDKQDVTVELLNDSLLVTPDGVDKASFTIVASDPIGLWDSLHVIMNVEIPTVIDTTAPGIPKGLRIYIYPNPFTGITNLIITSDRALTGSITVYDVLGRRVDVIDMLKIRVDVNRFQYRARTAGHFTVQFTSDNGHSIVGRMTALCGAR